MKVGIAHKNATANLQPAGTWNRQHDVCNAQKRQVFI